ncbi:hypothetical protein MKY37_07275 [Psychrobacillus sp. FSL K6-2836]|uniref:hypothetical protein n=1 Tax=Psychrobacillus sp. FSL K6-2836 TaxID=2921548 RepID=UPI0030F8E73C
MENAQKLLKLSKWTYVMLYFPLLGYTLNPDLYFLWLILLFIGGLLLLFKNKLIQGNMKTKITLIEAFTTLGLIFLVFSNLMPIIKQLILLIVVTIIIYSHTKLVLAGKLT